MSTVCHIGAVRCWCSNQIWKRKLSSESLSAWVGCPAGLPSKSFTTPSGIHFHCSLNRCPLWRNAKTRASVKDHPFSGMQSEMIAVVSDNRLPACRTPIRMAMRLAGLNPVTGHQFREYRTPIESNRVRTGHPRTAGLYPNERSQRGHLLTQCGAGHHGLGTMASRERAKSRLATAGRCQKTLSDGDATERMRQAKKGTLRDQGHPFAQARLWNLFQASRKAL